ncbi:alkane 1-monooxygenase [Rhodobacter sp. Har01]|uniref:alkane 1-monooxygenase n=1 Tax=Rhodobacter sp. Har01 TaxID=2883999 RepID=UPI001D05CAD6|nr:alkane 1-monooxygenase [Rhodobacter sp. Har01]MCB6178662.1 alkane 1-monooxygenase [Rhodobacter sp. Har01]
MMDILKKSARPVPMIAFTLATVLPAAFLAIGASQGGMWLWLAFLYMAAITIVVDQVLPFGTADAPEGQEVLAADNLLVGLGAAALVLMMIATWAIAGSSSLSFIERLLMLLGTGLWLGQVAHPAAHELIHRTNKPMFHLGQAVYSAMLVGHHASAHRLVHHRHVATDQDPNSAREGETFYQYLQRAWKGSFDAGLKAENEMRARSNGGLTDPHPYLIYIGGAVLALIVAIWIAGVLGLFVWLLLSAHATVQIFLSDYVQHYGLRRAVQDGRTAPVGLEHSWNTAHWLSSATMLNAPRHSDHHANPTRPYPLLRLPAPDVAPQLPWPLPMACTMALFPTTWKARMEPLLARWRTLHGNATVPPETAPDSPAPAATMAADTAADTSPAAGNHDDVTPT